MQTIFSKRGEIKEGKEVIYMGINCDGIEMWGKYKIKTTDIRRRTVQLQGNKRVWVGISTIICDNPIPILWMKNKYHEIDQNIEKIRKEIAEQKRKTK